MVKSRIELREFEIKVLNVGVASHQYYIRFNSDGDISGELHGLATDRNTGAIKAVGNLAPNAIELLGKFFSSKGDNITQNTDSLRDLLKAYEYPLPDQPKSISAETSGYSGLYTSNQSYKVMLEGNEASISTRWNAAHDAVETLRHRTIKYDVLGGNQDDINYGNSNSMTRTLGDVMSFKHTNISGRLNTGAEKNLLPREMECYSGLYKNNWDSSAELVANGVVDDIFEM